MIYGDSLKVNEALNLYFSRYHFKNGGYNLKWFKIKFGLIYIPLPNINARVEAVKFHDIHHLVTEYNADYKGEVEIGAWEIASGCGKYYVAWILNMGSFLIGILLYQRPLFNAFIRGRKCRTNLYHGTNYNDELLNKSVGEIRQLIEPAVTKNISANDYVVFTAWCLITICYHLAIVFLLLKVIQTLLKLF